MIPVQTMVPMYASIQEPVSIQVDATNQIRDMIQLANCVCQIRGVSWNESTGGSIELVPLQLPIVALDAVEVIRRALETMTDADRLEVFQQIQAGYCAACGGNRLPCYCERDD